MKARRPMMWVTFFASHPSDNIATEMTLCSFWPAPPRFPKLSTTSQRSWPGLRSSKSLIAFSAVTASQPRQDRSANSIHCCRPFLRLEILEITDLPNEEDWRDRKASLKQVRMLELARRILRSTHLLGEYDRCAKRPQAALIPVEHVGERKFSLARCNFCILR